MSVSINALSSGIQASGAVILGTRDDHSHDHGLQHPHHWARERSTSALPGPVAANTAAWRTPSSALHDDALYGID